MNIEQLSKSQIILLTLLVSFVTSIATGIVTVSLMEQAPPSIAQSVNRIVERTVEKVVPAGQTAASIITREKTVVVKESDLISQAVERTNPSIVQVYTVNSDPNVFLGLAVVLDAMGTVVADGDVLGDSGEATVALPDGTRVRAFVTSRDRSAGIAFLHATTTTAEGKVIDWKPAAIAVGRPRLGQTVITLSGRNIPRIADGIVTAVVAQPSVADAPASPDIIDTNISADSIMPGGMLINTDGEVMGMSTGIARATSAGGFISSSALVKQSLAPTKGTGAVPK